MHPELDMTSLVPGQDLQNQWVMLCFLDIEPVLLKHVMLICLNIDNMLGEVFLLPLLYLDEPIDLFVVILLFIDLSLVIKENYLLSKLIFSVCFYYYKGVEAT